MPQKVPREPNLMYRIFSGLMWTAHRLCQPHRISLNSVSCVYRLLQPRICFNIAWMSYGIFWLPVCVGKWVFSSKLLFWLYIYLSLFYAYGGLVRPLIQCGSRVWEGCRFCQHYFAICFTFWAGLRHLTYLYMCVWMHACIYIQPWVREKVNKNADFHQITLLALDER